MFSDDAARRRLNAITHPRIGQRTAERADELRRAGEPLGCYEAALLVENGVADMFRPLVVVSCPEAVQIERVRARDDASREDAMARIAAQKPLAEKVAVADFVIDTDGPLARSRRADRRGAPGDLREARGRSGALRDSGASVQAHDEGHVVPGRIRGGGAPRPGRRSARARRSARKR